MEEFAQKMDQEEINTVYCFGDNPLSDIYGANLFTETLEKVNRIFSVRTNEFFKIKVGSDSGLG